MARDAECFWMIGILTLHYGYNEGAILQAYALATVLQDTSGTRAEIVDHRYPEKVAIYSRSLDARKRALAAAVDSWLPVSPRGFVRACEAETWRYVGQRFDRIVVGSDQVWRMKYTRTRFPWGVQQRDPFIGKFPNIYWPPSSLTLVKTAYAASVGDLDLGPIPGRDRRKMADCLNGFRVIGVRDSRTAEFVKNLDAALADRIRLCPDPTILMRWETARARDTLVEKLQAAGLAVGRPVALQLTDPSGFSGEVSRELGKRGYVVVGAGSNDDYSRIRLADIGLSPLEWVALFEVANVCITDRMHAFVFAVLNHCPCIVVDRAAPGSAIPSRISDFAARIGYMHNVYPASVSPQQVLEALRGLQPPWEDIDRQLLALRAQGMRVIEEIVSCTG